MSMGNIPFSGIDNRAIIDYKHLLFAAAHLRPNPDWKVSLSP